MALKSCKECGKDVGGKVKKCPHCGTDQRSWFGQHKILTIIGAFFLLGIIGAIMGESPQTSNNNTSQTNTSSANVASKNEIKVVSQNFYDFFLVCDPDATSLKKKDFFDTNFNGKYVEWEGEVTNVDKVLGSYSLQVKHCPDTFTSDIVISMRNDQKEKMLSLREGQNVAYRAKLTGYGDILGISASDGIIM